MNPLRKIRDFFKRQDRNTGAEFYEALMRERYGHQQDHSTKVRDRYQNSCLMK